MRRRVLLSSAMLVLSRGLARAAAIDDVRRVIAPAGALRVGVYRGSPSSIIEGPVPADAKGVGLDLGRALAARLGVEAEVLVYPSNDPLLAATASGLVDVIFTNKTAERAKSLDFSQAFMDVEKSFLVPADSSLGQLADFKRPGLRVGVSKGSSTAMELAPLYPDLVIETVATLKLAGEMLADHRLDAFATNDAILFQVSDGVPGSRVIPGRWGLEHFAAALPKGRQAGLPFVEAFLTAARADGTVARAIERAGLRGTVQDGGAG